MPCGRSFRLDPAWLEFAKYWLLITKFVGPSPRFNEMSRSGNGHFLCKGSLLFPPCLWCVPVVNRMRKREEFMPFSLANWLAVNLPTIRNVGIRGVGTTTSLQSAWKMDACDGRYGEQAGA